MKRIIEHLYVGTVEDVPFAEQNNFSILGAAKEPFHRKHARMQGHEEEGYLGKAMPITEPEYLWAERDHALYLNLIDARDMKYIPDKVINKALDFIDKEISEDRDVLIACNKCESRSPSIALIWLIKNNYFEAFKESKNGLYYVVKEFKDNLCQNYNPGAGIFDYVNKFWEEYCNGKTQKDF